MCTTLSLIVLLSSLVVASGLHVLILGDSVDRHIVEDWCEWTNSSSFATHVTGWGPESLKYGGISSIISPSYCENAQGDSIAQIHLFGSNPHGPYYSDKWEMDNSKFEVRDSSFRTTEGVRFYTEFYGVPDVVFLKTVNWDNALAQVKRDQSEVTNFIKNTEDRLREIESVVGKDVQLGVMTAPQVWYGGSAVAMLNTELREFAAARNLLIYDFDRDVWSTVGFHLNAETQVVVMRSEYDIHPKPSYSALAGEKILRRAYSGYFLPQGRNSSTMAYYSAIPKHFNDFLFVRSVDFDNQHGVETAPHVHWASDSLTYLQFINNTWHRWAGVRQGYLKHLHMGHADVMTLLDTALNKIELAGTIPDGLFDSTAASAHQRRGLLTTDGQCLLMLEGGRNLLLNSAEEFRYIGVPPERIASQFPARWLGLMGGLHDAQRVPPWLFRNWTLIRQHDEKQVYVVDDYQRRPINSLGAFTKYGFDFSDVKVTALPGLVALLPLGAPLE